MPGALDEETLDGSLVVADSLESECTLDEDESWLGLDWDDVSSLESELSVLEPRLLEKDEPSPNEQPERRKARVRATGPRLRFFISFLLLSPQFNNESNVRGNGKVTFVY